MPRLTLLLDLDGTLTDPAEGIVRCLHYALEQVGVPPLDRPLQDLIGPPLRSVLAGLLGPQCQHRVAEAIAAYRARYGEVGQYEASVYDGIPAALAALRGVATLCLATSKAEVYARSIVAHFGLAGYLDEVYGPELDGTRSGKDALIAHILEQRGLVPQHVAIFGDREHDILGARANGVAAYGVAWGFAGPGELGRAGAERIFRSPAELAGFFRARPGA